ISLRQLLEIVKPEIQQNIINAIANPDISRQHIPCKARKKPIFNDTASESSSTYESGSSSESSNDDKDFTVKVRWNGQAFVPASCSLPQRSFVLEKYGCHKNAEVLPQQLYK
ncbi:17306_t:CDS:2, partial [Racocetra fulgida]